MKNSIEQCPASSYEGEDWQQKVHQSKVEIEIAFRGKMKFYQPVPVIQKREEPI